MVAVEAQFAFRAGFSKGNGDGVFVDIQTEVECNSRRIVWLFVRVHMMNQNVSPAASEDVLAALPTRATRVTMNGNHTAFFNPQAEHTVGAVSHKV